MVGEVVVPLDVVEVDSLGYAWKLVQPLLVGNEIGVLDQPSQVAFEVAVVDGVEPNQDQKPEGMHHVFGSVVDASLSCVYDLLLAMRRSMWRSSSSFDGDRTVFSFYAK